MKITRGAREDIDNQKEFDRLKLSQKIKNKLEGSLDTENISYISKPDYGIEFQRLKIKENEFDHRIYFDYQDTEIVVFAVRHRDYAYSNQDLEEISERLENLQES